MTTSRASGSEGDLGPKRPSTSFDALHRGVQEWIWDRGWTALRDAQERAIPLLLPADQDVVIAASTAAGKTEAAFLPILSRLATEGVRTGVGALYLGPLKALINDQFGRLDELCERLDIAVHRWHGDVGSAHKREVLEEPSGVLLITPESLEGLLIRRGHRLADVFGALRYVVVDELHAFLGTERGRQLQSQLARLEALLGRRVVRVGLSATLGDMDLARAALRPGAGDEVALVQSASGGQELRVQVRGLTEPEEVAADPKTGEIESGATARIAAHVYANLRGTRNLVFANSRRMVEELTDLLRQRCEAEHVPIEFVAHHGSLARDLRENVERDLHAGELPLTAVCTSTLELGVDIGSVHSVAQIGAPGSVAALRQRLGRSGRRRGEPAILRVYVVEPHPSAGGDPLDELAVDLVQTIAMVSLLVRGFCEPPLPDAVHASTLVQQTLSVIAQHSGARAEKLHDILCRRGAFAGVTAAEFAEFLRGLAGKKLIAQEGDGTLLLGAVGERLVEHYSFLAAFEQAEEFRVLHDGRALGAIMVDPSIAVGELLVLGGRRWSVVGVETERRTVRVEPALGSGRARFLGRTGREVHDAVRAEMHAVWCGAAPPSFLDASARQMLSRAQECFARCDLSGRRVLSIGGDCLLYLPRGDRVVTTVRAMLRLRGVDARDDGPFLRARRIDPDALSDHLRRLVADESISARDLARVADWLPSEKHDLYVESRLLERDRAERFIDLGGARDALREPD